MREVAELRRQSLKHCANNALSKATELRRQATDFEALIFNNLVFFILSNNYVHVHYLSEIKLIIRLMTSGFLAILKCP
jgi:hypothetical protein